MGIEFEQARVPLGWFGRFLAAVRFNSISSRLAVGSRYLRKRRLRRASLWVPLANWYAKQTGMRLRVLTRSAWSRYEPAMYRLLLGQRARRAQQCLVLPRLPGRSLFALLKADGRLGGESELAVRLAVVELARLHKCWTPHPWHGRLQLFSHADATIENVLIDPPGRKARWIDFETVHEPALPALERHADDLLALLSTAAATIERSELPRLCQLILDAYGSRPVAEATRDLMRAWDERPAARQLAIPGLNPRQWRLLHQAIAATAESPR